MALQNLIGLHLTATEKAQLKVHYDGIKTILAAKCKNLTPEEKNQYGSINETNKLFANKVKEYRDYQPELSSPDVDWVEYIADWNDRDILQNGALTLEGYMEQMLDTKTLHDYDNYQNALVDYRFTKYKHETDGGLGFTTKYNELKQFFPNTGGGNNNAPEPPAA